MPQHQPQGNATIPEAHRGRAARETTWVPAWSLRRAHRLDEAEIAGLAELLIDCVDSGTSVSFMHPLSRDRAMGFWRRVAEAVAAGE